MLFLSQKLFILCGSFLSLNKKSKGFSKAIKLRIAGGKAIKAFTKSFSSQVCLVINQSVPNIMRCLISSSSINLDNLAK